MATTVSKIRSVKKVRGAAKRETQALLPGMSAESLRKVKAYLAREGIPETPGTIREAWEESVLSYQAIEDVLAGKKGEEMTLEEFRAFLEEA